MTRNSTRYGLLFVLLAGACSTPPPDADIRDVRPTQIERGDKVTVEASRPLFVVGAETTVMLDSLHDPSGAVITLRGRAVTPTRVLFDATDGFEAALGGGHIIDGRTTVTVLQTVGTEQRSFRSSPTAPFPLDLFPRSLRRAATRAAEGSSGGALWEWLGMQVADQAGGGVRVTDVVTKIDRDELFLRYDRPPLDGQITRQEARIGQPGGLSEAEFTRLDHNHSGVIEEYEFAELPQQDGAAARAGIRSGDIIVAAAGKAVPNAEALERAWDSDTSAVQLQIKRPAAATDLQVTLPRYGKPTELPGWIIWALFMLLATAVIALPVPVIGGLVVVWERKISAYMQSRIGPNRVGPAGWLQWLADGLKLLLKEDVVPREADPILFKMSPYLAFVGLFMVFLVIPFSSWLVVADLNIGLLYLLSVTSLVVVSIIMGGWSSNSKWSLLGGMRSAAQIISYELPASVALLSIATLTGSLSTVDIVRAQGGLPWDWYVFRSPFLFVAFFIYFISALAEGNRTPFDLPEAESELVAGYFTEYSGFRFSLFPLTEWVNVFVLGAISSMLFLGGWNIPFVSAQRLDDNGWLQLAGFLIFLVKIIGIVFVTIWIRWTLPRFRVDQMMNLCWKYFIPIAFACFIGTLLWSWILPEVVQYASRYLWFVLLGLAPLYFFVRRVQYNRGRYRDLNLQEVMFSS